MSETTRPAHEATGGHEAAHVAQHASAARILAKAQRDKAQAEAATMRARAEAEQRRADDAARREADKAEREAKAAKQAARREAKAARWRILRKAATNIVAYLREEAAAAYSVGIYGVSVGVAASAQAAVAHDQFDWPWVGAAGGAAFVEGLALSMALTAHRLRLRGERAFAPRVLTWAAAGFAAAVNAAAHWDNPLEAAVLAASSLAAITIWEIRTSARSRDALRAAGQIPQVRARLGALYWCRYFSGAFWAWSAQVATDGKLTRGEAIKRGQQMREARATQREAAIAQKAAQKALDKAARRGEAGRVLAYVATVARSGPAALGQRTAIGASPALMHPVVEGSVVEATPARKASGRPTGMRPEPAKADRPIRQIGMVARTDQAAAARAARVAALAEAFPGHIPSRREAQKRMGWTSNATADNTIKALKAARESDSDDSEHILAVLA